MLTLITGANGFLGSSLARVLETAGHKTRFLLRKDSDRRNLEGVKGEIMIGDLTDRSSLDQAVKGCDSVFHVAADYRLWVPDPTIMMSTNVEGTRNLLQAAMEADVHRIVYTSSVATLKPRIHGIADESDFASGPDEMIGAYKRSKYLAETAAIELADQGGPIIIVNPAAPVGPRDRRPTPTGRMVYDAMRGRMPAYLDFGINIVHVDDAAEGHRLALEKGRIGERYILGGENIHLRDLIKIVTYHARKRSYLPLIKMPRWILPPLAWLAESLARRLHWDPFITYDHLEMTRCPMYYSSSKAVTELGYQARPAEKALYDAVSWYQKHASSSLH